MPARAHTPLLRRLALLLAAALLFASTKAAEAQPQTSSIPSRPANTTMLARYAIVGDLGSTGTIFHYFMLAVNPAKNRTLAITPVFRTPEKLRPGIAEVDLANTSAAEYLAPLLAEAARVVPAPFHANTTLYLRATAGMRLVGDAHVAEIRDSLNTALTDADISPFRYAGETGFKIISGEEEGLYNFFSVNYERSRNLRDLIGDARERTGGSTVGALDLGGASTQISFVPDEFVRTRSLFPVRVFDKSVVIFSKSYLRYGVVQAYQRLLADRTFLKEGVNPCTWTGYDERDAKFPFFYGEFNYNKCRKLIRERLIHHDLFHRFRNQTSHKHIHIPDAMPIRASGEFGATASFFNISGSTTISNFLQTGLSTCKSTKWAAMRQKYPDKHDLRTRCFNVVYIYTLLADGYRLAPRREIEFSKNAFDWAPGVVIFESKIAEIMADADRARQEETSAAEGRIL